MKNSLYLFVFLFVISSCSEEINIDNPNATSVEDEKLEGFDDAKQDAAAQNAKTYSVPGMTYGKSNQDFETTHETIVSALEAIAPISILTQVHFSENAAALGLDLNNMKVIVFGNPALGTPLMQQNQLVGLDLPQKLLLFEDDSEDVRVAFNSVPYLKARHGLEKDPVMGTISGALKGFVNTVSNGKLTSKSTKSITNGEGIITKMSTQSFEDSYNSLVAAINGNPNLRLFAEHDHKANANSIGMDLNPTSLVIFGNPNMGTPLMQDTQTVGIDLPQKMLVWEDDEGVVWVSYNNPEFLTSRHTLTGNDDIQAAFTVGLNNLSNAAAGLN